MTLQQLPPTADDRTATHTSRPFATTSATTTASLLLLAALLAGCGWNEVRKPTAAPTPPAAAATGASDPGQPAPSATASALPGLWQLEVERIDGSKTTLGAYRGKALLIVNTASECGFTPQYEGLQRLYAQYEARGLVVLAFPSNDFGGQEPGASKEIASFCSSKFQITFPLFAKVHARGDEIAPLYRLLTEQTPPGVAGPVKWNFTKFLITPQGAVAARFEPAVDPMDPRVTSEVEKVLPAPDASKVEI